MPHTYSRILIHLIFSTKDREPMIDHDIRVKLWAYIAGIIRESGCGAIAVDGSTDHVHAVVLLPTSMSVSEIVRLIKSNSSKWVRETHHRRGFGWQRGYSVFSVSQSVLPSVVKYVGEQAEHHRKKSFPEEYLGFLRMHGITFDKSTRGIEPACAVPTGLWWSFSCNPRAYARG